MKEKAAFRNPDEFYFGMINSKTKGGVHLQVGERNKIFDAETIKLLKTQDQNYVNYQRSINLKVCVDLRNAGGLQSRVFLFVLWRLVPRIRKVYMLTLYGI
jgi:hypothetical protein